MSIRLAPGVRVSLDQDEWMIRRVDWTAGSVELSAADGTRSTLDMADFISHPSLAELTPSSAVHDAALERLSKDQMKVLSLRVAHVYEAQTGYRSGTATVALPDEPKPQYDPVRTTLTERRSSKARELDNEHAAALGTKMSVSTLRRLAKALESGRGLNGVVDRRNVRRSSGRHSLSSQVEAACEEVFERTRLDSNRTHAARYLLVKQYMREVFGCPAGMETMPSERTIRRWFQDRYLPSELDGKARTRRSATTAPSRGFTRANPTRPGELVCIDTCSLDVLLKDTQFAQVIRGVVVMAVDWYSRSIVALRVLEGSEQAIDVTFLLREIGRPKAMLPHWNDDLRWPFVGLPEHVLTDIYGDNAYSGLPFVSAESIVTDHGTTYKAHLNVAAAAQQGISILPARVRTGSDKQVVERTFGSMRTMLLQHLSGYRGSDPSERGEDIDANVKYDVQDIEDLLTWWVVRLWQCHVMTDARPDWCPEGQFTPNSLLEYGLAQTGMPLRAMTSDDYYALLPARHVKVHSRGVRIRGLFYDGPALHNLRNQPSPYGGSAKGKWTVKYDPRDLRRVFFLDADGRYQTLRWIAGSQNTPCFNDRHAAELTQLRRQRNIAEHQQEQLADILLTEVLAVHEPVSQWPTLSAQARKELSRRHRQEQMVERDQAASGVEPYAQSNGAEDSPQLLQPVPAASNDTVRELTPTGQHGELTAAHVGLRTSPSAPHHRTQVAPTPVIPHAAPPAPTAPPLLSGGTTENRAGDRALLFGFDATAYAAARQAAASRTPTNNSQSELS